MYKLTITKWEPLTESEKLDNKRNGYFDRDASGLVPEGLKPTRMLDVVLTEDEFKAVKRAAVEAMN